ncbi:MAG TPA: GntR family transcriptional regulator [Planctomycetota bacterium]|nr:GntR family transcriptional regulator [Planctomycetota bacterium]
MNTMPIPPAKVSGNVKNGGRAAAKLAVALQADIAAGKLVGGSFLPTERDLAETHGIGRMTVRRALKSLEAGGLIAAEPRHGYRVMARSNAPEFGCPLAYVLEAAQRPEEWDETHKTLLTGFQSALAARGGSLLSLSSKSLSPARVLDQLLAGKAWGAALDAVNLELLELVRRNGFPAVMVDAWTAETPIDAVLQDDYQGGMLAAGHLASLGHRRIAWIGPLTQSAHSLGRYAGAVAGLVKAGLELPADLRIETVEAGAEAAARALLSRPDRPDAIIALWTGVSVAVGRAARGLGLVVGRDLGLVGWSMEELYSSVFRPGFPDGQVPPAVVWSVADMAETAVCRLAERRANPKLPPLRINVPVRLRMPDQK